MRTRSLRSNLRQARLTVSLFLALVLTIGAGFVVLSSELYSQYREVGSLNQMYDQVSDLLVALIDEETGQRGYALTYDPMFRQTFAQGSQSYEKAASALASMPLGRFAQSVRRLIADGYGWHTRFGAPQVALAARRIPLTEQSLIDGERSFAVFETGAQRLRAGIAANGRRDERTIRAETEWTLIGFTSVAVLEAIAALGILAFEWRRRARTFELLRTSDTLATVGQLAAGVAHEIRNPLTVLKGFMQVMDERGALRPEHFEVMWDELDHIEYIASELLALAKPHANDWKTADLKELLLEATSILDTNAFMLGITLDIRSESGPFPVRCVRQQMKQAVVNVMQNGMEAMQGGGILRVSLYISDTRHVELDVVDEGPGMTEEAMRRLGEPFYTTKESGVGLGFTIVKRIVATHHGRLVVQSEPGLGSLVRMIFPLV